MEMQDEKLKNKFKQSIRQVNLKDQKQLALKAAAPSDFDNDYVSKTYQEQRPSSGRRSFDSRPIEETKIRVARDKIKFREPRQLQA